MVVWSVAEPHPPCPTLGGECQAGRVDSSAQQPPAAARREAMQRLLCCHEPAQRRHCASLQPPAERALLRFSFCRSRVAFCGSQVSISECCFLRAPCACRGSVWAVTSSRLFAGVCSTFSLPERLCSAARATHFPGQYYLWH